ncbi:hypothetical protein JHD50_08145 [Sulfurimonas sp. MAG313]|nr:hypothetical protein [Sulfurimonas sp. MAG313]MDF1881271.1 hypothetical protein [Sulfurimonas sp. MAG313]
MSVLFCTLIPIKEEGMKMKKIVLIVSLIISANAGGLWSMAKNVGLPEVKSKGFTIPVEGVDARAYIFEPLGTKNKQCVIVFTAEIFQMECFDKDKK